MATPTAKQIELKDHLIQALGELFRQAKHGDRWERYLAACENPYLALFRLACLLDKAGRLPYHFESVLDFDYDDALSRALMIRYGDQVKALMPTRIFHRVVAFHDKGLCRKGTLGSADPTQLANEHADEEGLRGEERYEFINGYVAGYTAAKTH